MYAYHYAAFTLFEFCCADCNTVPITRRKIRMSTMPPIFCNSLCIEMTDITKLIGYMGTLWTLLVGFDAIPVDSLIVSAVRSG